jgi:hypothetical protein
MIKPCLTRIGFHLITRTLSLEALCDQESISVGTDVVKANKVVIIPKRIDGIDRLNSDFIPLIKKIRLETQSSYIAKRDGEPGYYDFRGGEYELPLLILQVVVLPIVLGIIANRIDKMLSDYLESKKKNPKNTKLQEPSIKARWYITESQEYFELEGPASEAAKTISKFLEERSTKSR